MTDNVKATIERKLRGAFAPSALETVWERILPSAQFEAGELCLRGEDGHWIPTGSLIRITSQP